MAKLGITDKKKLEKLFDMGTGYVLDFSDKTFQEFIHDAINIDIYDEKYNYHSGSKANRLRAFWKVENDDVVGKLLWRMLEYWKTSKLLNNATISDSEQLLFEECQKLVKNLYDEEKNQKIINSILPKDIDSLIKILVNKTPKSIIPLQRRRKNLPSIDFNNEYDYQDYLHSMLIPWVKDIRPEEYVPSYAGTSKRVDFFLKEHQMFIEVKFVRDKAHSRKLGDEMTIDIHHYQNHPKCKYLVAVIYDPNKHVLNPNGFESDLSRKYISGTHELDVKIFVVS